MKKFYPGNLCQIMVLLVITLVTVSCKKDKKAVTNPVVDATPTKLGLYEMSGGTGKILYIAVSQVGTKTFSQDYGLDFDTGSAGMSIDAHGIIDSALITTTGFNFTGDTVVNHGITITRDTGRMEYGDKTDLTIVYGTLAYANVTFGQGTNTAIVKRLPFFLYYKAEQSVNGKVTGDFDDHYFDICGVGPTYSYANNNILSPFSYFDPGTGLTKGFKLAALGTANFSPSPTNPVNVLTLGLTSDDLSSTSGFVQHTLPYVSGENYSPNIPSTITYGSKTISASVVFDSGTTPYNYIEDRTAIIANVPPLPTGIKANLAGSKVILATGNKGLKVNNLATTSVVGADGTLATGTTVTVTTNKNFVYSFITTNTEYLTMIENPATTGDTRTILSIEYFLNNEYMLDYADHILGLKNN